VTEENPDGDLDAAFDVIQASQMTEAEKTKAETAAKSRVTNRRAEAAKELEVARESDRSSINQSIYIDNDYDESSKKVLDSSLPENEKQTYLKEIDRRASAVARGVPLKNDRVVENNLYEMSLDIWRGNVSKEEFDKALLDGSNSLDDEAYKRVSASAASTLKTSQAQALARADSEAANVLVNFKSEDASAKFLSDAMAGLDPDASKLFENNANEVRQLQFNNLTQYNFEARQWVADNPDKTGKDFFQFKEALKHEYWNKNVEDLRQLRIKQNEDLKDGEDLPDTSRLELSFEGPPAPITVTTQAQYDKLPVGTEYLDINGNRSEKR
jgi:hypothetical protein